VMQTDMPLARRAVADDGQSAPQGGSS
jgi:hypothetical protein